MLPFCQAEAVELILTAAFDLVPVDRHEVKYLIRCPRTRCTSLRVFASSSGFLHTELQPLEEAGDDPGELIENLHMIWHVVLDHGEAPWGTASGHSMLQVEKRRAETGGGAGYVLPTALAPRSFLIVLQ